MLHIATITFRRPLAQLTPSQREALADVLSPYAADIKKGTCIGEPLVRVEIPDAE